MATLKCKMCGGELVLVEGSCIAECEYCGTRQTVPNADNEKKLNLFARANRLRSGNEFDKAAGVYESIVTDFPEEAEAYWGLILCQYGIEYVDDPGTGKKIPTCHRSSFNSLMDDPNFELVMEYADPVARKVYREEAKQIEELRKGIIEVSSREEPYDIFICYKETDEDGQRTLDSVLAQDIYDMLTENGYRVFFSRISLEDKLGVEYEPYIFAALNSAKIMLAVGTDYDYYNAVWVKNEWSRFLQLIAKGEKKTLIPCFKNIDAYDMPKEFAKLQAQDLGKIGALQDLLRGIGKILPKKAGSQSGTAPQPASQMDPLLRRAFISLENGEWAKADDLCEQVLNQEPENAHAYLGKLMAELQVRKQSDLARCGKLYINNSNFQKAFSFGDAEFKSELKKYVTTNIAYLPSTPEGAFSFSVNDNGYTVTGLADKTLTEIVIPRRYQGKPVTAIGDNAFRFRDNLINVTIPDSVTSIGNDAFDGCKKLTSITIPGSVTHIGDYAFRECENLTGVIIPDGVTTIGRNAFESCTNLTSISISDSVTKIGNSAFADCKNLTNITIPDTVTSIGSGIFEGCEKLADKNGFVIFRGVLHAYCGSSEFVTIPRNVTAIGSGAFKNRKNLIGVTIPNSVTSIGGMAFYSCTSLTNITIPDSVTFIGAAAFQVCTSLASITIPDSVTFIGWGAFLSCTSLTSITIPDKVTAIGDGTFNGCTNLANVTIPDSVTTIGKTVFKGCEKLADENGFVIFRGVLYSYCGSKESITIPETVTAIGHQAFKGCKHLVDVTIPNSVTAICHSAFDSCTNLTRVTIPSSVTVIENGAFYWCSSLSSVTIPDSVTAISDVTFMDCKNLSNIVIPDSVTQIGSCAFSSCTSLDNITIPDSVTSIGDSAFSSCTSLTSISLPDSVDTIGIQVFNQCNNLKTIICRGDYEKLKSVFAKNYEKDYNVLACLARGAKEIQEQKERILREQEKAAEEKRRREEVQRWKSLGYCEYCGFDTFKGLIKKKCGRCGRIKEY